jgi:hypothetical protein
MRKHELRYYKGDTVEVTDLSHPIHDGEPGFPYTVLAHERGDQTRGVPVAEEFVWVYPPAYKPSSAEAVSPTLLRLVRRPRWNHIRAFIDTWR